MIPLHDSPLPLHRKLVLRRQTSVIKLNKALTHGLVSLSARVLEFPSRSCRSRAQRNKKSNHHVPYTVIIAFYTALNLPFCLLASKLLSHRTQNLITRGMTSRNPVWAPHCTRCWFYICRCFGIWNEPGLRQLRILTASVQLFLHFSLTNVIDSIYSCYLAECGYVILKTSPRISDLCGQ